MLTSCWPQGLLGKHAWMPSIRWEVPKKNSTIIKWTTAHTLQIDCKLSFVCFFCFFLQLLCSSGLKQSDYSSALLDCNHSKNRNCSVLPGQSLLLWLCSNQKSNIFPVNTNFPLYFFLFHSWETPSSSVYLCRRNVRLHKCFICCSKKKPKSYKVKWNALDDKAKCWNLLHLSTQLI